MPLPQPWLDLQEKLRAIPGSQLSWIPPHEAPYLDLQALFSPCEKDSEHYEHLAWLALFAARRALACWELYCDGTQPQETVAAVRAWLEEGQEPTSWEAFVVPALPSYKGKRIIDCREADTGAAAASSAALARFILTAAPTAAIEAIHLAYVAFSDSPLWDGDHFHDWLIEVAIPAAYERRDLTLIEQVALREDDSDDYDDAEPDE